MNEIGIQKNERQLLLVAAWFHDAAYGNGNDNDHEERGAAMAREFLIENGGHRSIQNNDNFFRL